MYWYFSKWFADGFAVTVCTAIISAISWLDFGSLVGLGLGDMRMLKLTMKWLRQIDTNQKPEDRKAIFLISHYNHDHSPLCGAEKNQNQKKNPARIQITLATPLKCNQSRRFGVEVPSSKSRGGVWHTPKRNNCSSLRSSSSSEHYHYILFDLKRFGGVRSGVGSSQLDARQERVLNFGINRKSVTPIERAGERGKTFKLLLADHLNWHLAPNLMRISLSFQLPSIFVGLFWWRVSSDGWVTGISRWKRKSTWVLVYSWFLSHRPNWVISWRWPLRIPFATPTPSASIYPPVPLLFHLRSLHLQLRKSTPHGDQAGRSQIIPHINFSRTKWAT